MWASGGHPSPAVGVDDDRQHVSKHRQATPTPGTTRCEIAELVAR